MVVPVLAVAGWLMFGPRGQTSGRVAKLTVVFPLAYMLFTVIRGPLASDFYPYPFADVRALGYIRVLINGLWIGLLFVALAAAATALDKRLGAGQHPARTRRSRFLGQELRYGLGEGRSSTPGPCDQTSIAAAWA